MGLRKSDLKDLLYPVFEIDSFKSKMGDDEDIAVVSFSVKENNAANDLVEFIEKSYDFVLDADSTVSEIDGGLYKVFVEIERNKDINSNIMEMLYGVGKLSEVESFKFRYHKNFRSHEANLDNLQEMVPVDSRTYTLTVLENAETFFSKTPFEKLEFLDEALIIKKSFADPLVLLIKDFNQSVEVRESINETINVDAYPEIMFLTKYLGDYNINKYGDKIITLENEGHTLVVERP